MPTRGEIAAAFDEIAEEYDLRRPAPWPETLTFEEALPRTARVLDLACGGGRNAVFLRSRGHSVVGLDASLGLLRLTAAKLGSARLVRGDLVTLPFHDATFDAVHCTAAIHHLPTEGERRQVFQEMGRTLRPGGIAMVSVWALEAERFQSVLEATSSKGDVATGDTYVPWRRADGRVVQRFYHLFREGELASLAQAAVLRIDWNWREGDNHVVLARR